jgi:(p)ppGpp synthase/HD superfamily hydrolase
MAGNINSKPDSASVTISITAKDRNGLVHEIAGTVSQLDIAILHHEARVYNNRNKGLVSESTFTVGADSEIKIDTLINRLKKIKGVINVNLV